jgi:hypothetical protein
MLTVLTACKGTTDQPSPEPSVSDSPEAAHKDSNLTEEMNLSDQIAFSHKDLANRLGLELDSIVLEGVRKVNWRSGALGCPTAGMNYTQAIVPGVVIALRASGKAYSYHAKTDGRPFYCPAERIERPIYIQAEDIA